MNGIEAGLSLGSNLDDRLASLQAARAANGEHKIAGVVKAQYRSIWSATGSREIEPECAAKKSLRKSSLGATAP